MSSVFGAFAKIFFRNRGSLGGGPRRAGRAPPPLGRNLRAMPKNQVLSGNRPARCPLTAGRGPATGNRQPPQPPKLQIWRPAQAELRPDYRQAKTPKAVCETARLRQGCLSRHPKGALRGGAICVSTSLADSSRKALRHGQPRLGTPSPSLRAGVRARRRAGNEAHLRPHSSFHRQRAAGFPKDRADAAEARRLFDFSSGG